MPDFIPDGWKQEPLRNLARVVSGGTPSRNFPEFWENGDIPWATPTDITCSNGRFLTSTREFISSVGLSSSSSKLLPIGSLLMTSRATLGEVKIAGIEVCTNQGFKSLVPYNDIDALFLFYQIKFNKQKYSKLGIGSTFLEVNKRDTENFLLQIPSYQQQKKISRILASIDDAIELTESLVIKYQQIKAGLIHDLFTRGVTPDGKLRPSREEAPEIYWESPIGWIPKEWEISRLQDISHFITSGSRGWADFYSDSGPLFLRIGNLTREHINFRWDSTVRVSLPNYAEGARTMVVPNDILISITADLGIVAVVPSSFEEAYVNQHIALVRPKVSAKMARFIGDFLCTSAVQKQFVKLNDSGAKAGLNLPAVGKILVVAPNSIAEAEHIADIIDSTDDKIMSLKLDCEKLKSEKAGLMQDLLTGRVQVNP